MFQLTTAHRHSVQTGESLDTSTLPLYILTWPQGLTSDSTDYDKRVGEKWDNRYYAQQQIFTEAQSGSDIKATIEKELRKYVCRENLFTTPEDVEKFLTHKVYKLRVPPRIMTLPAQSLEAATQACTTYPQALAWFGRNVIIQFLGNSYSLDWSTMKGVGEKISLEDMAKNFPRFCQQQFGEGFNPAEVRDINIPRLSEREVRQSFTRLLTERDISAIIDTLDTDAQGYTGMLIKGHWPLFADRYEGLHHTHRTTNLAGKTETTWQATEIYREWAIENAVCIGTVSDLIKAGLIQWPEPTEPLRTRFFRALTSPFTESRKTREDNRNFKARVDALRPDKDSAHERLPVPLLLPGG